MAEAERHDDKQAAGAGEEAELFAGDRHDLLIEADDRVRAALDEVLQACWYSDNLIVANMATPRNQSVYEEWLQQHIGPDFDVLCLTADLLMTPEEIFDEIKGAYQAWEGMELEASAEGVLEALNQESLVDRDRPRELLIQVDQAHELGEGVLEGLLKLVEAQDRMATPHIVLWGEMSQTASLETVFAERDAGVRYVEVPAFTHDAIRDYLETCWAQLNTDEALPLGEQQINELITNSNGRAAEVDRLARALLVSSAPAWRRFLPRRHGIAAIGMLVVLGALVLFWRNGGEDEAEQVTRVVTPEAAPAENGAAEDDTAPAPGTDTETESAMPGGEPLLTDTEEEAASLSKPDDGIEPESQPDDREREEPGSAVADESEGEEGESDIEGTAGTQDLSNQQGESEIPAATNTQTSAADESPAPSDPLADENGARMDVHVRQAAEEAFFLQLLGVSKEDSAEQFVADQAAVADDQVTLGYIESRRQGASWFVVLLGPYADRAAAEEARETLPDALRERSPWLRRAKDLKTSMNTMADSG